MGCITHTISHITKTKKKIIMAFSKFTFVLCACVP